MRLTRIVGLTVLHGLALACGSSSPVTAAAELTHLAVGDCTPVSVSTGERCTSVDETMNHLVALPGGAPSRCPPIPFEVAAPATVTGRLRATQADFGWTVCCDGEGSTSLDAKVRTDGVERDLSVPIECSRGRRIIPTAAIATEDGCISPWVDVVLADGTKYGVNATPTDPLTPAMCVPHGGTQVVHLDWQGLGAEIQVHLPEDSTLPLRVHVDTTPGAMVDVSMFIGETQISGGDCDILLDGKPRMDTGMGCTWSEQAPEADLAGHQICGRLRTKQVCGTLPPVPWTLVGTVDFR
jgi:hypothetical protein